MSSCATCGRMASIQKRENAPHTEKLRVERDFSAHMIPGTWECPRDFADSMAALWARCVKADGPQAADQCFARLRLAYRQAQRKNTHPGAGQCLALIAQVQQIMRPPTQALRP